MACHTKAVWCHAGMLWWCTDYFRLRVRLLCTAGAEAPLHLPLLCALDPACDCCRWPCSPSDCPSSVLTWAESFPAGPFSAFIAGFWFSSSPCCDGDSSLGGSALLSSSLTLTCPWSAIADLSSATCSLAFLRGHGPCTSLRGRPFFAQRSHRLPCSTSSTCSSYLQASP